MSKTTLAVVFSVALPFLVSCATGNDIFTPPIPEVDHHDQYRTMEEITSICKIRVRDDELPCSVMTIEDEICYAFMDLQGVSKRVQCFKRLDSNKTTYYLPSKHAQDSD